MDGVAAGWMYDWVDGWMDGWVDEWRDGWMRDARMEGVSR